MTDSTPGRMPWWAGTGIAAMAAGFVVISLTTDEPREAVASGVFGLSVLVLLFLLRLLRPARRPRASAGSRGARLPHRPGVVAVMGTVVALLGGAMFVLAGTDPEPTRRAERAVLVAPVIALMGVVLLVGGARGGGRLELDTDGITRTPFAPLPLRRVPWDAVRRAERHSYMAVTVHLHEVGAKPLHFHTAAHDLPPEVIADIINRFARITTARRQLPSLSALDRWMPVDTAPDEPA